MKKKPLWLKWLACLTPAAIALLLYFLLPLIPGFAEYALARGVFRVIGFPLQWLTSLLPLSLAELLAVLSIPSLITLIVIWIIKIVKSTNKKKIVEKGTRIIACVLSVALLVYILMHGANYNRIPLSKQLMLPNRQYTAEDLYRVTCDIAQKASKLREKLPEDKNGCVKLTVSKTEILDYADDSYNNLRKEYSFLKVGVSRAKPVRLSNLWSYTGTTGMYFPWTGEANVNTDVPDYLMPYNAAHEIAHTMGYGKEDECSFLAWLACSKSDMPDYKYSGYLSAYIYCINTLYDADRQLAAEAAKNCSEGMWRDLENRNRYWAKFEGEVMESAQDMNDTFIKVNGDQNGILSYGLMVELLLRYYDKDII